MHATKLLPPWLPISSFAAKRPDEPDGYMVMLRYKNESLTREDVQNQCVEKSWVFSSLTATPQFICYISDMDWHLQTSCAPRIHDIFHYNAYSASLGAALRAAHGWLGNARGSFILVSYLYKTNLEKISRGSKLAAGRRQGGR
ncbi:unnamed protein product [Urochloa humidicola]